MADQYKASIKLYDCVLYVILTVKHSSTAVGIMSVFIYDMLPTDF